MKQWAHDELANDLAAHLKAPDRMVWTDMQLGRSGSQRPDVYTIDKSYVRPNPTAYECKISVSDFRADVTVGKWSGYLDYAYGVVFAAPAGLIAKVDVPAQCGLILRHEAAWRYAKRPTMNPRPIDQEAMLKLLIDGVHREGPKMRAKWWNNQDPIRKFTKRFGTEAARYVSDAAETHRRIEAAGYRVQKIIARAEEEAAEITKHANDNAPLLWAQLLLVCGLAPDAGKWDVEREVRKLREAKDGSPETRAIRLIVANLRRSAESLERLVPEQAIGGPVETRA